jgi:uncharacterized protein YbjT (DUF2867 family)
VLLPSDLAGKDDAARSLTECKAYRRFMNLPSVLGRWPPPPKVRWVRVAIAGGAGKVGRRLIGVLVEAGDEVRSLDRNPAHADSVREAGAEPVTCDLESAGLPEIAAAIDGVDAVVFAVGAGPGSGPEPKWTIDYAGAVKLMAAATVAGVPRYVIVSSIGADPNASGDDAFAVYLRAKGKADEELQNSGLDYTVVRPSGLTDDPGRGRVDAGETVEKGKISRDDVAAVLAATLKAENTIGKTFSVTRGETPIAEAIAAI